MLKAVSQVAQLRYVVLRSIGKANGEAQILTPFKIYTHQILTQLSRGLWQLSLQSLHEEHVPKYVKFYGFVTFIARQHSNVDTRCCYIILSVSVCPSVRLSVVCPVPLFIETAYRVVILSSEYYGSHPIHSSFRHFCEIPTGSALRGRRIRCVFKFRDSLPIDRNQGWQPRVWQPRVSPMFPSCKKLSPWKLSHREYFCFRQRTPPPVSHMLPRENLFPWKFTVITLCALLTRDLR